MSGRLLGQEACCRGVAPAQEVKHPAYPGHLPSYAHRDVGCLSRWFDRDALLQFPAKGYRERPGKTGTMYPVDPVLLDGNVLGRMTLPHVPSPEKQVMKTQAAVRQMGDARLVNILVRMDLPQPLPLAPVRIGQPRHDLGSLGWHPLVPLCGTLAQSGKQGHPDQYPGTADLMHQAWRLGAPMTALAAKQAVLRATA